MPTSMEDLKKPLAETVAEVSKRLGMPQDDFRNWIIACAMLDLALKLVPKEG
ncbi:MAG: hypothetical protein WC517_04530 [Patescibacteria group bacterium]